MAVSRRVSALRPSTLAMLRIHAAREAWTDLISMAGAEVAIPPPRAAAAALEQVVSRGSFKYGPCAGDPYFLALIRDKLRRVNDIHVGLDQVYCMPGAATALHAALTTLIDEGDEVLIQDPCWDHFPEMVRLVGGIPKRFRMIWGEDGHLAPDLDHLRSQISPATRAVLINTPLNPCGAVLRQQEIEALVETVAAHGLTLISDEAYEAFTYAGHVHVSPGALYEKTVTVHSFSKTFALPGLRLAYVSAPVAVIEGLRSASLYSFLVTSSVAQAVGAAILESNYDEYAAVIRRTCEVRLNHLRDRLSDIPFLKCRCVEGGLYLSVALDAGITGQQLTEVLFHDQHVLSIPGSVAGSQIANDICLFFGLEEKILAEGALRIGRAVRSITPAAVAPVNGAYAT